MWICEKGYSCVDSCDDCDHYIEVDIVRHGAWDENIIGFCNVCMECGAIVERTAIKNKSGELNYCPNCGAKMGGATDTNVGNKRLQICIDFEDIIDTTE